MKNSEIFYFDVDGTILDNQTQKINPTTFTSINQLKALGYKVVMCTGRTAGAVLNSEFQVSVDWDAYVLANGGTILNNKFEVISDLVCEPNFIHELSKLYPEAILLEGSQLASTDVLSENMQQALINSNLEVPKVIVYNNEPVQKIIIEHLDLIEDGFNNPIFANYDYHLSAHNFYEIFPRNSGKHIGIAKLNKLLNVNRHTFFGDGSNDVLAIKLADVGVAMENGVQAAKDKADFITKSVAEDGITYALKNFKVI